MAGELKQRLDRLENKARLLAQVQKALLDSRRRDREIIADLTATTQAQRKEIEALRQEIEYLKIARTVSPTREDVAAGRALLNQLVRDIDRCIADIGE